MKLGKLALRAACITWVGAAVGCASTYGGPAAGEAPSPSEVQVVGAARIERPAEVFRLDVEIDERAKDQVAALAAASAKLDQITAGVVALEGLESYAIESDDAYTIAVRPPGCELDGSDYYGDQAGRPADCSPVEIGALLSFTLEGAPASAAGAAIAYVAEMGAENVSLQGFDVADREAALREAKQAALADAISTAQALAAQAGVTISRPTMIRYGEAGRFDRNALQNESELIVVTGSRRARPQVQLTLSPPPVEFAAEVAASFEIR